MHASLQPVLIDSSDEVDYVTFLEAEFTLVLGLKVIQSLATWLPPTYNHIRQTVLGLKVIQSLATWLPPTYTYDSQSAAKILSTEFAAVRKLSA